MLTWTFFWQTAKIFTLSKLSKMHLLLGPLLVRRSSRDLILKIEPVKGQFWKKWCHAVAWMEYSRFYVQNHAGWWATMRFLHFAHILGDNKLSPFSLDLLPQESMRVDWGPWSRLASLSIYESCQQTRTMTPGKFKVDLGLVCWWYEHHTASPCSVFVMLQEGECTKAGIAWRLPSS